MERAHTPIATPAQRQAIFRNQMQRLRNLGEALLRAAEALPPPKTPADAKKCGEALLVVEKVIQTFHVSTREDERITAASVVKPDPIEEARNLSTWTEILDASLAALDAKRDFDREQAAAPPGG